MTNIKLNYFSEIPTEKWNDWKWQVSNRITTLSELKKYINISDDETIEIKKCLGKFKMAITPYYLSLIDPDFLQDPIKKLAIPSPSELHYSPEDINDPLGEDSDTPVPGLVHRYPDRVLLLATSECAMYCRYCTRRRFVGHQSQSLSLDNLNTAFDYISNHKAIRDVLISGGDPLMLMNDELEFILKNLRKIDHVEIIRIGTKTPVVLPQRITGELTTMLRKYHPIWINTHFSHPSEITDESKKACEMIVNAGIPLGNQNVLLAGVNDCIFIMKKLMHELVKMRIRPYYMYQCDLSQGYHISEPQSQKV